MIMRDWFFGIAIYSLLYYSPVIAGLLLVLYIFLDEGTKK